MSVILDVVTDMTLPAVPMIGLRFALKRRAGVEVAPALPPGHHCPGPRSLVNPTLFTIAGPRQIAYLTAMEGAPCAENI